MIKKTILRSIFGFPIGLAIGYLITIFVSLFWADGHYSPCMPELINALGNEINAVLLQAILCGLIGSIFAAISIIWDIEHWSIVKQTGIYFTIASLTIMPIAYLTYWMEHSIKGFLSYFGIFISIFIFIWIIKFIMAKQTVKNLNIKLTKIKNK